MSINSFNKMTQGEKKSPKYTDDDFEKYINLNIKMLSALGIFVGLSDKKNLKKFGILEKVPLPTIITIILSISDGFCQAYYIEKETATETLTNIFSNISCVSKGFRLCMMGRDIQVVLDDVYAMWNANRPKGECREEVIKEAHNGLLFVKCYVILIFVLISSFCYPSIQSYFVQYRHRKAPNHTYDFSQRVFPILYPFEVNTNAIYFTVLFQEMWVLFGLCLLWVCCDTIFASLTTHLRLQLKILQNDIHTLFDSQLDEDLLKENLRSFVHRHREIIRISNEVERIFSPVVLINVLVSSMNICVNVFQLQEKLDKDEFLEAGSHLLLALNTFFLIIVYCAFAESFTQQTVSFSDAIYSCKWMNKTNQFKICIQILIMRSQRPFYFTAYGFFAVTHERLTTIVKTALSYYMMLKTTS